MVSSIRRASGEGALFADCIAAATGDLGLIFSDGFESGGTSAWSL
jgi:hypothetical protein